MLKIGNLKQSMAFFQNVLGLRVLRHEEFESGCEATCNGPYGGAWSKTMIGYGPESANFALELTYNYGIDGYAFGNDLQYIAVANPSLLTRAAALGYNTVGNVIQGPDNYKFKVLPLVQDRAESFMVVAIRVSSLSRAVGYWRDILGMTEVPPASALLAGLETHGSGGVLNPSCVLTFGNEGDVAQTMLQLIEVRDGQSVDHALSSGRMAFACQAVDPIHAAIVAAKEKVLTPPLRLPTPGKADVVVTILSDRDGYEICFVEDAAFYDLATPKYDVIDFAARASRGGDGAPLPRSEKISNASAASSSSSSSSSSVIEITDAAAVAAILNQPEHQGKTVVLDFSAGWCKNCKKIAPVVSALAREHAGACVVCSVDIDDLAEVAVAHDVSTLPRLLFFRDGAKVGDYLGSNEADIRALFASTCK